MDDAAGALVQVGLHVRYVVDAVVPSLPQRLGVRAPDRCEPLAIPRGDADDALQRPVPRGAEAPDVTRMRCVDRDIPLRTWWIVLRRVRREVFHSAASGVQHSDRAAHRVEEAASGEFLQTVPPL